MASLSMFILNLAALLLSCSASKADLRIVGGEPTSVEKYPIIVQVDKFLDDLNIWYQRCGGSILTSRYIMTAAHCFVDPLMLARDLRVRAGSSYRNTGGIISNVASYINHPTFGLNDFDGDISLLTLETRLVFSNVISQAAIISHGFVLPDNLPVTHIGWGRMGLDEDRSEVLREVEVFTVNNDLCRERYIPLEEPRVVTENMICAGILDVGGKGACFGDSGSPILYGNIVVAIVSFGEGCANGTAPGVNTAVSSYTNWILENVH